LAAAALAGDHPSPQDPVGDFAKQYYSADAVVGASETAASASAEKTIIRMTNPSLKYNADKISSTGGPVEACRSDPSAI